MSRISKVPEIRNLHIRDVEYDLSLFTKMSREKKEEVVKLLPGRSNQKISFILANANAALANAIRRTVLMELKTKSLHFDMRELRTNNPELILQELYDRISYIPLDQNTPMDAVFSLNFSNTGDFVTKKGKEKKYETREEYATVYSGSITQKEGTRLAGLPFSKTHRLLKLLPATHVEIPRITVVEGYGYEHAKWSITSEFKYQIRDYIEINSLNERGNIISPMVRRDDLIRVLKEKKIKHPLLEKEKSEPEDIYNFDILTVPKRSYLNIVGKSSLQRIQKFSVILEDVELPAYSSLIADPKEFFLEFTTYGNISPKDMMLMVCDNLIERFEFFLKEENLVIQEGTDKTKFLLRNEDHTLGNLLKTTIYQLDPSIGLVNSTLEHPQIRVICINIIHPNPKKIFFDATKHIIETLRSLRVQFNE